MDFKVLFQDINENELPVSLAYAGEITGFDRYEAREGGLEFCLLDKRNGAYGLRITCRENREVTGRALVRFAWQDPAEGYTLIPGVYYNGNYTDFLNTATFLHMPERPRFRVSLAAASSPHVLWHSGDGTGRCVYFSQSSCAGLNGAALDGEKRALTFSVPAGDDDCRGGDVITRYPYTWHRGDTVSCEFTVSSFPADKPGDLFKYLFDSCTDTRYLPCRNAYRAPREKIVELVRNWIVTKHYIETEDGRPILKNAFCDFSRVGIPEEVKEWNIITGWCSGTMTALPLLKAEGEIREKALKYIDFLTAEGFSPSGIKMPVFDGKQWIDPRPGYCPVENAQYIHLRFFCDYLYYLGRAIRYENSRGESHPAWEADFAREIGIVLDIWDRYRDFGLYWDIMQPEVKVVHPGTGAGAYALLALTEAYIHGIQPERIKKTLSEANEIYYARCVRTGRCTAGPNDIKDADDSESIAALTDAYIRQYELFGGEGLLTMALEAGRIFASWVIAYTPEFPGGTMLRGINVCGGVIANVQNRHVTPGVCTNSALFLKKLGAATGDRRWTEMYERVLQAACNCACLYDGEFMNENFREAFRQGMVSEQINVYDVYSKPGYSWVVSAGWPATDILLSDFDRE